MADASAISTLLGENILSRNNLSPRWDKGEKYAVMFYIWFFVLFGIKFTESGLPHCIPTDKKWAEDITVPQSEFFASYCNSQNSWENPSAVCFGAVTSMVLDVIVVAMFTSTWENDIRGSVNVYIKAETQIEELDVSLTDLVHIILTPNLGQEDLNTSVKSVREAIKYLVMHKGKMTAIINFLVKRILISWAFLSLNIFILVWLNAFEIIFSVNDSSPHIYKCSVRSDESVSLNGNFSSFVCSLGNSNSNVDAIILCCYVMAVVWHLENTVYRCVEIFKLKRYVIRDTGLGRDEFLNGRQCMLLLATMNRNNRGKPSLFYNFLKCLYAKETYNIMMRSVPIACGRDGNEADEEYIYIFAQMAHPSHNYDNLIDELVNERKWKPIVILLNTLSDFHAFAPIGDSILRVDTNNRNILFYALNATDLKPGAACFLLWGLDAEHRVVLFDNQRVLATDFIQSEYDNHPTYPEHVKVQLQGICSNSISPPVFTYTSFEGIGELIRKYTITPMVEG